MRRTEKCAACGRTRVCIRPRIGIALELPVCLECAAKATKKAGEAKNATKEPNDA